MRTRQGYAQDEHGRAEYWILLATAAVLAFAFLWGLVLHDKPPRDRGSGKTGATTVSATATTVAGTPVSLPPVSLPPPRTYKVVSGVNVRQGPATNTSVVARLPAKSTIVVECRITGESVTSSLGNSDQWVRILTPVGSAYVSALYVDLGDAIGNRKRLGVCPRK